MTAHDRALAALMEQVHDTEGWLSDAQYANLAILDESVVFCGEGSIDVSHMVSIVLHEAGVDR